MTRLRLHLPPNLPAAAVRDAIALRIELASGEPSAEEMPVLAVLQSLCATPTPPAFVQLSRRQLAQIVRAAGSLPVFVEAGRVVAWSHPMLLEEPAAPVAAKPPPPSQGQARKPGGEPPVIDGSEHYLAVTPPPRDDPRYGPLVDLLRSHGFVLEPSNRKWWLRDRHKTLTFLAERGAQLRGELGAVFTSGFRERTSHLVEAEAFCSAAASGGGWEVEIGLRAEGADEGALRAAVDSGRSYAESAGRIVLLDPSRMRAVARAQGALSDTGPGAPAARRRGRISPARAAEVEDMLEQLSPGFRPPGQWALQTAALRSLSRLEPVPLSGPLAATLRPYQALGAAWLWHLHRSGLGGVLADEMGLGKTLQALAVIAAVRAAAGRSLVVCPASLVENWRREAARFVPGVRVLAHHGQDRLSDLASHGGWDLLVTSYGVLARDQEQLSTIAFACAFADEAQHVKNARTLNARALRSLQAGSRFLLTGTPVENSMDDLRSLFDFALPGYLGGLPSGLRGEDRAWLDERIRAKTARYILRRTKAAVAPELPEKIEQVVWCPLEPAQAALYRRHQEASERELLDLEASGASEGSLRMATLTQLLRLRQICCDPRLVDPAGDAGSAKLEALREVLDEAIDGGHRILLFSQFTSLLALVRQELESRGLPYSYLDGSMPTASRQAQVDRFQAADGPPVFLLSLKAGGSGLNLTAADTVVHFDPWWNPAAEAQATDRAHRIGQSRVVTSYKLVCPSTVEERVLALQSEKRALLAGVFEASEQAAAGLSLGDLRALISTG